jgi:hypothetical protein
VREAMRSVRLCGRAWNLFVGTAAGAETCGTERFVLWTQVGRVQVTLPVQVTGRCCAGILCPSAYSRTLPLSVG